MRILLDINVVLDVLLDRQPWVANAREIWRACDEGRATGVLAAISLPTIFYIVRKVAGLDKAREAVDVCLDAFEICAVDARVLDTARTMAGSDFEDNVQIACATFAGVDTIVTRDPKWLANDQVPVKSPDEIAELLLRP